MWRGLKDYLEAACVFSYTCFGSETGREPGVGLTRPCLVRSLRLACLKGRWDETAADKLSPLLKKAVVGGLPQAIASDRSEHVRPDG